MFANEASMQAVAVGWLKARRMIAKSEFVTPWGICDVVGLRFNNKRVAQRLMLQQTKALGSITRATLLLQIPDVETGNAIRLDALTRQCATSMSAEAVAKETERLIADRFVTSSPNGLQKRNGWMPLQERLVAVELKLSRIDEVMHQALNNLGFASESFAGLPSDVARRVASSSRRWSRFFDSGVGLLSVGEKRCRVLVPSHRSSQLTDDAIQLYCVDKFWRTRSKTAEHQ